MYRAQRYRGRDISFDNHTVGLDLLPKLLDDKGIPQPTLERIHIGHPTLSLLEDHIAYFMTKVDHLQGSEAWVIAVDMKNKVLRGVSNFDGATRNRCMTEAYMHSSISGHLNNALGTRVHLKRPGIQMPEWCTKKVHLMGHVGAELIGGCSSQTADDYGEDTKNLDQNS
ncbi:uncharacterized protein [Triticum aestivum]|uniref:uncharacterized protein n=1 Tax=Triticum aestivum TaxID=4565 RepID=UPI001D0080EA|nr:uncharacterized protein LOC123107092 [Triticum aestivum]